MFILIYSAFLLREVKEFWRVGLLISTMLYPSDTDSTQDFLENKFELDRRKDLFKAAEDAIVNLGTRHCQISSFCEFFPLGNV